jgi:hypothetical protein
MLFIKNVLSLINFYCYINRYAVKDLCDFKEIVKDDKVKTG